MPPCVAWELHGTPKGGAASRPPVSEFSQGCWAHIDMGYLRTVTAGGKKSERFRDFRHDDGNHAVSRVPATLDEVVMKVHAMK